MIQSLCTLNMLRAASNPKKEGDIILQLGDKNFPAKKAASIIPWKEKLLADIFLKVFFIKTHTKSKEERSPLGFCNQKMIAK